MLVAALERAGVESDEFAPRFLVLRSAVTRHAASEERTVLALLEQTQDPAALVCMAEALRAASVGRPTRISVSR